VRTLLYAATLLWIKSDYLKDASWGFEEEDDKGRFPDCPDDDSYITDSQFIQLLEHEITR